MTRLTPEQDKAVTVNTFINSRFSKTSRINDYEPMTNYLNGGHIEVLYSKLPKSGQQYSKDVYASEDAKMYLEWLIAAVMRSEPVSEEMRNKAIDQLCRFMLILADETEWKDGIIVSKPYDWVNRLEEFEADISQEIKSEIQNTSKALESYEYNISGYTKQLDELSETIDEKIDVLTSKADELKTIGEKQTQLYEKQTSDLASMLQDVLLWMKKYGSVLDKIEKDYQFNSRPQEKGKTK